MIVCLYDWNIFLSFCFWGNNSNIITAELFWKWLSFKRVVAIFDTDEDMKRTIRWLFCLWNQQIWNWAVKEEVPGQYLFQPITLHYIHKELFLLSLIAMSSLCSVTDRKRWTLFHFRSFPHVLFPWFPHEFVNTLEALNNHNEPQWNIKLERICSIILLYYN